MGLDASYFQKEKKQKLKGDSLIGMRMLKFTEKLQPV